MAYCPQNTDPDDYNYCCTYEEFGIQRPSCCRYAVHTGLLIAFYLSAVVIVGSIHSPFLFFFQLFFWSLHFWRWHQRIIETKNYLKINWIITMVSLILLRFKKIAVTIESRKKCVLNKWFQKPKNQINCNNKRLPIFTLKLGLFIKKKKQCY